MRNFQTQAFHPQQQQLMKQKILVTRPIWPDIIQYLQQYFEVEVNTGKKYSREELITALQDKEGLFVAGGEKIDGPLVAQTPKLRAVCISAAGYNSIDVKALAEAGIITTNSPGPADETVADYAWGLLIAVTRKMGEAERWLRNGEWTSSAGSRFFGIEVHGKTLGIIGMGGIGKAIAKRAAGFNNRVLYHNRHRVSTDMENELHASYRSKEDLLKESDFIMLSLPLNNNNYHIIGANELDLVKPGSILINIARGGLIDEVALADALKNGKLAGAGLDVFEGEPTVYPPLLQIPNLVLTPHIAGGTERAQHGLTMMAAENLVAALGHGPDKDHPRGLIKV